MALRSGGGHGFLERPTAVRLCLIVAMLVVSCAAMMIAVPPPSLAFGPVNGPLGGGQSVHEAITASLTCGNGQDDQDNACFQPKSGEQLQAMSIWPDKLTTEVGDPAAHCDNADYMNIPHYGQSREQATSALNACRYHFWEQFQTGLKAASKVVSEDGAIEKNSLNNQNCDSIFFTSAKCDVLRAFGRVLHGVQDFYAHSNWADHAGPGPISLTNPPGLGLATLAPFLDFTNSAGLPLAEVDPRLSTECWNDFQLLWPQGLKCKNRILHSYLSKDDPNKPRSRVDGNYAAAVGDATRETARQWRDFLARLSVNSPGTRGEEIACVLTHDNPGTDCRLPVAFTASGSSTYMGAGDTGLMFSSASFSGQHDPTHCLPYKKFNDCTNWFNVTSGSGTTTIPAASPCHDLSYPVSSRPIELDRTDLTLGNAVVIEAAYNSKGRPLPGTYAVSETVVMIPTGTTGTWTPCFPVLFLGEGRMRAGDRTTTVRTDVSTTVITWRY